MRRLIFEEPVSQAAMWSRRLAVFAVAVAAIDVMAARYGLEANASLTILGAALLLAICALLLALVAAVVIWRTGRRGTGVFVAGALLALALLAYPGFLAVQAYRLPALKDVTSDIDDPPAFSRSSRALAARAGLVPPDASAAMRRAQRRAYPDLQPVLLDLDGDEAYRLVLKAVAASGWRAIDQVPPGGRSGLGHIDAIARSLLLRLPSDLTIRLRPLAGQTRIDIRSATRIGPHDFGANAERIAKFAADLQAQAEAK